MASEKDGKITLDLPVAESKQGYIETILSHFGRESFIISSNQDIRTSHRMWYNAGIIIAMMPEERQEELLNFRKKILEELKEEKKKEIKRELTESEVEGQIIEAAIRTCGKAFSITDDILGVSKEHRLGLDFNLDSMKKIDEQQILIKKLEDEIKLLKGEKCITK